MNTHGDTASPPRDAWVHGMEIEFFDPPSPYALKIHSRKRQEDWGLFPEHIEDLLAPEKAPTTIIYWDELYCVTKEYFDGAYWIYGLKPWPENEHIFKEVEISNEAFRHEAEELRSEVLHHIKEDAAPFYQFLFGWLPASIQHDLSEHWGFSPEEASHQNSALMLFFGLSLLFFSPFIGMYIVLDSFIRAMWCITEEKALGLIILEIPERFIIQPLYRALKGEKRQD